MSETEQSAVLIYTRQSQDSQASKDEQEHAGRVRAEQAGWPICGVYRDGVSASRHSTAQRKDWTRLLADLDRPDVGVLWLWESSRGDRTLSSWAAMLDRCREHRVRIYVESHGRLYDMATPRDWRTLAEDGVDSAYESDKISLRVTRSMATKAAAGEPHGRVPYGYTRKYELTQTGKRVLIGQVPDPAQAKVVRRIFRDIQRGVSLRAISADLNTKDVPTVTGASWTPQRVRDIALNIAYAGIRSHLAGSSTGHARRHSLGEVVDGTWPALVSVEQYHQVRALLLDPKRRTSRPGRAKHLLSMIATCAVCGGPLSVRYAQTEPTYSCRNAGHVRVPQDALEEYITGLVFARLTDPAEYELLTADDGTNERLDAARDELAELRAHHADMVRLLASRKLSAGAFADAEPPVLADIARAETQVTDLESPTSLRALLGNPDRDLAARWRDMTAIARRQVVRVLFEHLSLRRSPSLGHRLPIGERVDFTWRTAAARRPAKARRTTKAKVA